MSDCIEVREATFEGLADRWNELLRACDGATVFLTPTWQEVWWKHFCGGAQLKLLEFKRSGVSIAVAPLMSRDGVVSFLGDTDLVDYHDILVAGRDTAGVTAALLDHVAKWPECRVLDLKSIPGDSPTVLALTKAASQKKWESADRVEDVAPGVTLPESFDAYLAGLEKKDRHELRRKLRRLYAAGNVEQVELRSPADIEPAFDDFFRLVRLSSPEKRDFLTPARVEFVREVTLALAARDMAQLYMLSLDGKRVATSLCFRYEDKCFGYNSGYDPAHRALAVGLLNHALCLERVIGQGIRYFDFMRGDEHYKYDLGAMDREIHHVVVRR